MLKKLLDTCKDIQDNRDIVQPTLKLVEEVGELSTEVNIGLGNLPKSKGGDDGVLGEACDVIITALDIIYQDNKNVSVEDIENAIERKITKWRRISEK